MFLPERRADQRRPSGASATAATAVRTPGSFAIHRTIGPVPVTGRVRASPTTGTSRTLSTPAGRPSSCIRTKAPACRTVKSESPFSVTVVSVTKRSLANRLSASASPSTGVPSSNRTGSYTTFPFGCALQPRAVKQAARRLNRILFIVPSFACKDKNN